MERTERFPIGAGLTRADLAGDPHPHLHRLREHEPVSWVPDLGGWLVTGYELAVEALRDPGRFTVDDPRFSTGRVVGPSMLSTDGDIHRANRSPFEPIFRPAAVHEAMTSITATTDRLLDRLMATTVGDGTADLRTEFAAPLATKVICDHLGLTATGDEPGSEVEATVLRCYRDIVAAVTDLTPDRPVPHSARHAVDELNQVIGQTIGGGANVAVILFGAIETSEAMTANAIVHALTHRARHRSEWVGAQAPWSTDRDGFLRSLVNESVRLEPAAAVVDRYATVDADLGRVTIGSGDLVVLSLAGANRDPAVFEQPDTIDIDRLRKRGHLTFARGPHSCLGIHLAMAETTIALRRLCERLPRAALVDPAAAQPTGLIFRKPRRVHINVSETLRR